MKAITIHQPWATLIALGEKQFETRSWVTKYSGPIAIHAGKKVDKEICLEEPFRSVLAEHGFTADNLPTGAVVAICQLGECHEVMADFGNYALIAEDRFYIGAQEYHFGNYESGRYAWELLSVKPIDPVPAKGQQGLWNWGGERDASRT
ncbi:ASCH domain-containing protein [Brevibacillus brevis]|uniref:ASCH domain-containing protein n=1 Tax=Brevibacillus brevis TaxID=1393 RepID=UPI001F251C13|nr:ASCH domain-containing protein [Brevibacillus brevis]UIO44339.1 ASCH domain-containing protein [Brevibacillus brevis]